jgi:predicted ATPase
MSVCKVTIENFKSIKSCDPDINALTCLIGENGAGKSNVLQAIRYFYAVIATSKLSDDIFDTHNKFNNTARITLRYDMTRLARISAKRLSVDAEPSPYFRKILSLANSAPNNILEVCLTQRKNGDFFWNMPHGDLRVVSNLFPLHFIDCHDIDVNDWATLWNAIGDLIKPSSDDREELRTEIRSRLDVFGGGRMRIKELVSDLGREGIDVDPYSHRDFASVLGKLYLNGERFRRSERKLGYYSIGTNSVNYLLTYANILSAMSRFKLKEPLLILDEPEIHLHHKYVDALSDALAKNSAHFHMLIATHSPRLTKNLLKSSCDMAIHKLHMHAKYSVIQRVRLFDALLERNRRYRITDEYANAYFSQGLLLVEGVSEIELFSNPYIRTLFPVLERMDLYEVMHDDENLKIVSPRQRLTGVPYLCLIDMDQCFQYDKDRRKIHLKKFLKEPLGLRAGYAINNRAQAARQMNFLNYRRIAAMAQKCKFHTGYKWFYCTDENYKQFLELIVQYMKQYNIFPCLTTIEGALINDGSREIAMDFMAKNNAPAYAKFQDLYNSAPYSCGLNLLRMAFRGKSDMLLTVDKTDAEDGEKNILNGFTEFKKANGWITDFLEFYFLGNTEKYGARCKTHEEFCKIVTNNFETKKNILYDFRRAFAELSAILDLCNQKMSAII